MIPILKKAGITVNHQTLQRHRHRRDAVERAQRRSSTSQLNPNETVTMLPWQSAANAQQFGLDVQQQGKKTTLFGTDGTDSPSQFKIPGTLRRRTSVRTSRHSTNPLDSRDRQGRRQVRPVRRVRRADLRGDGRRHEGDRVGLQGRRDAEPRERPGGDARRRTSRDAQNPLGIPIAFTVERQPGRQLRLPVPHQRVRASTSRSRPSDLGLTQRQYGRGAAHDHVGGAGAVVVSRAHPMQIFIQTIVNGIVTGLPVRADRARATRWCTGS